MKSTRKKGLAGDEMKPAIPFPFHKSAAIQLMSMADVANDSWLLRDIARSLWNYDSEGHWEVALTRARSVVNRCPAAKDGFDRFLRLMESRKDLELV